MHSRPHLFSQWKQDLPASLVVFLVALPLCLGIALASGAPLISGVIAGAVGGIVVGLLSGSPLGVSGPAAGLTAIMVMAISDLGTFESVLMAVIIAGMIQIVLGLLRAGVVAYYFPSSVIKGMLAGIGVIIILKEIPHAFGYDADYMGDMDFEQPDRHTTFSELYYMLDGVTPGALVITVICLALLILWDRPFIKRFKLSAMLPGPLIAVVVGALLTVLFDGHPTLMVGSAHLVNLPDVHGLGDLPHPAFSGLMDLRVWKVAFTIAIVASLETLLCVEATDKLDPWKRITPTDRELRAQGIGNMVSGLLGGLPVTQVIVRSSANIQSGGRSRLSTVMHGSFILLSVLLIPGLLRTIPLASLAAILLVVGYKLAKPSLFKSMWQAGWYQFIPFLVTVLGVVLTDLLTGVAMGSGVAIFFILRTNFLTPFHFEAGQQGEGKPIRIQLSEDVTFLNKASIQRTLEELPIGSHVVIDATRTVELDPDVKEIIEDARTRALDKGGSVELIGFDRVKVRSQRVNELINRVSKAVRISNRG